MTAGRQGNALGDVARATIAAELDSPDVARLLVSGAVPLLSWRQGSCIASGTGTAIHNLNAKERDNALRAQGICPWCKAFLVRVGDKSGPCNQACSAKGPQ